MTVPTSVKPLLVETRLGRREVLAILISWAAVALIRFVDSEGRAGYGAYLTTTTAAWAAWTFLILAMARHLSPLRVGLPRKVALLALSGHLIGVAQDTVASLAWNGFVRPASRRTETLHLLSHQMEELWSLQSRELLIFGLLMGIGLLRVSHAQIEAEERRSAQLSAQVSEARMAAMRMQLNTHFFFNTLHAVSSYIRTDPERAQHLIVRLGDLMRTTFSNAGRLETTLARELAFIEAYVDVMKARVGERLGLIIEVPTNLRSAMLPELILQPLVENAVTHGIEASSHAGDIRISAERRGSSLRITIEDDGPGLPTPPKSPEGGVGLKNVRERLAHLYGTAQSFSVEDSPTGGVVAEITLPFHEEGDMFVQRTPTG